MAKMRFRPLNLNLHRLSAGAVAWLAGMGILLAGSAFGRPIQIVPTKGATISTNINQAQELPPTKNFDAIGPGARHPFNPDDSLQGVTPTMLPPPTTRTLTPQEKELLDRRRNWVFMTPEELMSGGSADDMLGARQHGKDGEEDQSKDVMERYYEKLMAKDQNATTNRSDKDSDSWDKPTNAVAGNAQNALDGQNDSDAHPYDSRFDSPFNSTPTPGVFQTMRPNSFSDAFSTTPDNRTPTPEMIQADQEQKAHLESFKEMWDIGQPSAPPSTSFSASSASASESSSFPSLQPVLGAVTPSVSGSSAQPNSTSAQPAPTPVHTPPPRPNFTMPQRPF